MCSNKRFPRMVALGIRQFNDPYYQGFAAQISFYLMLSLVPILLLVSQILGALGMTLEDSIGWILQDVHGTLADTLRDLMQYRSAGFKNIIYIIIALWASSRAQFSLMRINNFMFTEGRTTGRGYWRERIRAVLNMFVTLFAMVAAMVFLTFGDDILKLLTDEPQYWMWLRWPVALILFFLMISFNYFMLPEEKYKYTELIPGSIFASVGLLLVSWIYAMYTSHFAEYDIIYGSLATIVALMFWFFFVSWILVLGQLFNKVWMDTKPEEEKKV